MITVFRNIPSFTLSLRFGRNSRNRRVMRNEKATLTTVFESNIVLNKMCGDLSSRSKNSFFRFSLIPSESISCSVSEKKAVSALEKNAESKSNKIQILRKTATFINQNSLFLLLAVRVTKTKKNALFIAEVIMLLCCHDFLVITIFIIITQ